MGWKDWPYWLKGGIIGAIIAVIVCFIVTLIGGTTENYLFIAAGIPIYPIIAILKFPINFLLNLIYSFGIPLIVSTYLEILVGYSILGLIIGWLYGKFKNR